jgi:anaerobic magnesium-protoporphyrin IX monomethyl ester cyclase
MRLLILVPNSINVATVSTAVPILAGLAKYKNWEVDYFDTYIYKKKADYEAAAGKAKTGGFKPGFELNLDYKKIDRLIPDLQSKIDNNTPDVIAITCLSPEYNFLMTFFGKIKMPSNTKIIIGGIHATLSGDTVTKTGMFDLVALGEGEETFLEILSKVEGGENLSSIPSTHFFNRFTGEITKNPLRKLLPTNKLWEIDRDFSFFDEEFFVRPFDGKKIKRNDIEISRGCPYHCSYCGNSALKLFNAGLGKYVKTRPIISSINEMKNLVDKYKIDIFSFMDECFLAHPISWLKEFMDAYKAEINKPYFFMTRPETITEKNITFLLDYEIPFQPSIGVESGSDDILLNVCDRSCTVNKIIPAFEILNKHKIRTNTFFIVGFPFEKREDTIKSIKLCKQIKPSVSSISIFQPYPGQKLTKVCIDNGFISPDDMGGTFATDSLLNMPPPYLSKSEITNLWRVFMLYAMLPEEYHNDIEKCELDYENHQELFDKLVKIRWDKWDLSKIKGDIKLV